MRHPVLVLGIGRPRFGDDAVGPGAAEKVRVLLATSVRVAIDGGSGWSALHSLDGEELLVLVDAAEASARMPPGAWLRLQYPADSPAIDQCLRRNTHTFGLASVLRVVETLGCLPPHVWLYVMAGQRFTPETEMSPEVEAALPQMVRAIVSDVRHWLSLYARSGRAHPCQHAPHSGDVR
ncbi:MAG: hydrogenase maturation protease [Armatimonadota bacterium]|nr:hydrogenase maturation protease [Armatimonadota bacterium]